MYSYVCFSILHSTKNPIKKVNTHQWVNGYINGGIADQNIACSYKKTATATLIDVEKFHEAVKLGMQDAEEI